jgi:hypothetical protein
MAIGGADPGTQEPVDFQTRTLAELETSTGNPNLVRQVRRWQWERRTAGQGTDDWGAARTLAIGIGGGDPGAVAPVDFPDEVVTLAQLEARTDNPNLVQQVRGWQAQRRQIGEEANDWGLARDHIMALSAPDPGTVWPVDFAQ